MLIPFVLISMMVIGFCMGAVVLAEVYKDLFDKNERLKAELARRVGLVFMNETHGGNQYEAECPACGKTIKDLWDLGRLVAGDKFDCKHCDREIEITTVDMIVEISLRVSEG
jgi:peptide subunit release factor 1 (eRF1)